MTVNVLLTTLFVGTLLKVNVVGVTVRISSAVPVRVTVLDDAPPPLMLTVALWVPGDLGLYSTSTTAPAAAAAGEILVVPIEKNPELSFKVNVRLPVRLVPETVKPSRYAPLGTPLNDNDDGLTVIVGVMAVPFNATVPIVVPSLVLILTVALWVPAAVGL